MAEKAASMQELRELHRLITKSFTTRIKLDLDDNIPTDAATMSGAVKFLKDNAVTADPAEAEDLHELRKNLVELAEKRKERANSTLSLVKSDMAAEG